MAQGMHADIMNILVSKRLDRWRRHISEKRRKRKSRIYCIPVKPFIWFQTTAKKKGWQNWKFPHIFPIFSPSFLPIFSNFSKWQKWNVSITGQQTFARTLSRSKPLFARMNSCCAKNAWFSGCTASASTNPVPGVAMSLKHLIYDISCVCVRMNFSAICCLSLEYDHLRAYTSRKGECHNNNADDWKPPLDARKNGETPSRHSSAEVNEASNSWKCEGKLKLMTRSGKRRNSTWPSLYGRM